LFGLISSIAFSTSSPVIGESRLLKSEALFVIDHLLRRERCVEDEVDCFLNKFEKKSKKAD